MAALTAALLALVLWASPPASAPVVDDWTAGWAPDVVAHVEAALSEPSCEGCPPPVAAFDFDNTLIFGDISFSTVAYLTSELRFGFDPSGPGSPFDPETRELFRSHARATGEERAMLHRRLAYRIVAGYEDLWRGGREVEGCRWLAAMLAGLEPAQARKLALDAFAREELREPGQHVYDPAGLPGPVLLQQAGVRVREPMRRLLRHLEARGVEVWLVSASPEPLVAAIAQARYGISPERVLGVRSVVRDGRLTGEPEGTVPYRKGKVDVLLAAVHRRPVLAFGDAFTDLELLLAAERGVLIDRGNQPLKDALARSGTVVLQPMFAGEVEPR
jgi:phosphoserine phosphatase